MQCLAVQAVPEPFHQCVFDRGKVGGAAWSDLRLQADVEDAWEIGCWGDVVERWHGREQVERTLEGSAGTGAWLQAAALLCNHG